MIRPVRFDFNAQTAVNNSFQKPSRQVDIAEQATREFDNFVTVLEQAGIDVTVVNDTPEPHTPDSVFPNNWISFHHDGRICLYPMFAPNRRLERKEHVLNTIAQKFHVTGITDITGFEESDMFLEGTGSMVLDRENKIAYACLSPRTHLTVLQDWCKKTGYTPLTFTAIDDKRTPIYHTNVMMCVADRYAVVALGSINNLNEREVVENSLHKNGKMVIPITLRQMNRFAGNMLQVRNKDGQQFLVMSTQAYQSLHAEQVKAIEAYNPILHANISTIETNGGGSARCMMAEIFLPVQ